MIDRRSLLARGLPALIAGSSVAGSSVAAQAQSTLPDKTIRLVVGVGTGGGSDVLGRKIASQLERRTGRRIEIDNRPAGGGGAAAEALLKGPADGSLMALLPSTALVTRLVDKTFPVHPLADLAPIALVARFPVAIAVSPRTGVDTLEAYLTWLKVDEPERRRIGTVVPSEAFDLVYGSILSHGLGAKMKTVGYRTARPMLDDLESGRLAAAAAAAPTLLPGHRGRRLRIVLVTGTRRLRAIPDVPAGSETTLPIFDLAVWYGFFAGRRTPPEVIEEWNRHIRGVMADSEIAGELAQLGLEALTGPVEEARTATADLVRLWRERLRAAGIATSE